jgi:hypothetical protein
MPTTLGGYLTSLRRLLRDSSGTLYPDTDLTAFINEARHQRDLDTRLVQKVVGFNLTANLSDYSLAAINTGGTFLRGIAECLPREIISLNYIPNGGSIGGIGLRVPLGREAYSTISVLLSQSWPTYPKWYAILGWDQVCIAPPPAYGYPCEFGLVGIYPDLVADNDPEPMPDPWNDPVPYFAAFVAKNNAQRFDEAETFLEQYGRRLNQVRTGIYAYAVPNPGSSPRG